MARGAAIQLQASSSAEGYYVAFNPWREFCAQFPALVDAASRVREDAVNAHKPKGRNPSHRGYYVGASIMAYGIASDGGRPIVTDSAINIKTREDADGICAERVLTDRVKKMSRSIGIALETVGLVVIGEPQPDQATGFRSETLWMCSERCWQRIIVPGKIPGDALIATVRPDKHKTQVQTASELDEFYGALIAGERHREPITFDHDSDSRLAIVEEFNRLVPLDLNPFADEASRRLCVESARVAIQGGYGRLHAA
jgi:hypothetical protein